MSELPRRDALLRQMEAKGFGDLEHERGWHAADLSGDAVDRDRADLFGLGRESRSRPVWLAGRNTWKG